MEYIRQEINGKFFKLMLKAGKMNRDLRDMTDKGQVVMGAEHL